VAVSLIDALQSVHFRIESIARRALNQPLARAAMLFASVTGGVKVASFVKEAVVAAAFGVSGAMDVYLMGLMLIGVPSSLLLNAVQTAFIPLFVEVREKSGKKASAFFLRSTVSATMLAMAAALLLWFALLPWIIDTVGHGFDPAKRNAVRGIFLWLVPYYFLNGLNLVGHGALQAQKRFLPTALAPLCTVLVTIAIVLGVSGRDVHKLALALGIGSLLEWLVLHWQLRQGEASLLPGQLSLTPEIHRIAKGSAVLLGGSFVLCFSPMIEQGLASGLGKGTIAAMGYAFRLPTMVSGILVTAVGVTVLPFFAEMMARRDEPACERAFRRYALALLAGGTLLMLSLVVFSEPLVVLGYQRGVFSPSDAQFVAQIQRAYLVQIPGALVGMLAVRLLVAQGAFRVVAVNSALTVIASGGVAWALSRRMGAVGIALGLSIVATISAVVMVYLILRKFGAARRATGST
jgi:putative peptidoglycan lipid II flippase